ncbi:conjugal transfer transcriptional regulator TraJ [Geomonas anaerohicana]|uniref:Conjugal transfer transcriptional regulator TraJ n=1 Tax=Geomonas anaerohicana TaxID=2798583 RepID=A0ABS0YJ99_9BACT|nr:conjugal transfer transcriptional regulator TraJ [Geomonas anaerohicana]MBJ6752400.1 conjugal transfer transcriptional regulator TraJ [Geomonas anaerohicana]
MTQEKRPTRKKRLRVPVLPDEEAAIKKMAASTGLPVAVFLRNVGLGYQVGSILDHKAVEELVRINGDLGRLGGLLKLWLADDPRAAQYGERLIRAVLSKIEDTRDQMHGIMQTVVRHRPGR